MKVISKGREEEAPQRRRGLREGGFTLLEIMVALAILGGVIVTALASISYHLSVMDSNMQKTLSSMLLLDKFERIRLLGESEVKRGDSDPLYEGRSWSFSSKKTNYSAIRSESITVRQGSSVPLTMETLVSGE